MSCGGILGAAGPGKGISYPQRKGVFRARTAVTAGGTYMLAEDADGGTPDSASVTLPADNSNAGSLGNVVASDAAAVAGFGTTPAATGKELATFILAAEDAAVGQDFLGYVEGYDVDCFVTRSAQLDPRQALYVNNTGGTQDTTGTNGTTIGTPCVARLLRRTPAGAGTAKQKVHFCGLPGGFGVGGGTT